MDLADEGVERPCAGQTPRRCPKEFWDEAVLLVRRTPGEETAMVFMAGQFKAEKRLSALKQALQDAIREGDAFSKEAMDPSFIMGTITFTKGGHAVSFPLVPLTGGRRPLRYVANTSGSRISQTAVDRLRRAGVQVRQLEAGITAQGMRELARAYVKAVLEGLPGAESL